MKKKTLKDKCRAVIKDIDYINRPEWVEEDIIKLDKIARKHLYKEKS